MLIIERLTSASSRSLAVMIGFARMGFGCARGGRSGSPDVGSIRAHACHLLPSSISFRPSSAALAGARPVSPSQS
jgi:hypothetical protein